MEGCAELRLLTFGSSHRLSLSGAEVFLDAQWLYTYAERYVERFTVTLCSKKLVITHNVSLRIQEDLGPSLLHASPDELPTHNNREKGDYLCKNPEMGTVYINMIEEENSGLLPICFQHNTTYFVQQVCLVSNAKV